MNLIGLDFETSGTDPWGDAVPIQLGIATDTVAGPTVENYLIGKWDWSEFTWSEESEAIHGIAQADLARARPVWQVDIVAAAYLIGMGLTGRMWNVAVGWNVAGFDRQFITRWMPNLNRLLSYRTIDLNALVFLLSGDKESEYKRIKSLVKDYAAQRIGGDASWHDAGYDALAALMSFEALQRLQRGDTNLLEKVA